MSTRIETDGGVAHYVKDDDDLIHARGAMQDFVVRVGLCFGLGRISP